MLAVIAVVRRSTSSGRVGAVTWAVIVAAVLIAAPIVIGHQAPKGRHALVVAVDAATGDVRWRVTTPGWEPPCPSPSPATS